MRPSSQSPLLSFPLFFFLFYFRWDAFVPLHRLWLGYMSELLGLGVASPSPEGPNRAPALPQPAGTMQAKLIKADFHGSIMTGQSFSLSVFYLAARFRECVVWDWGCGLIDDDDDDDEIVRRSKNAALVGVSGIVVQETENTFKVVTRKNKSKGALMCVYACVLKCLTSSIVTLPSFFFLMQCYQSRGPFSRSPSLCIVQNLAAAGAKAGPTHNRRRRCWMALTLKLSCTETSSVFGPRIERGGSSSTRRPSSSNARSNV